MIDSIIPEAAATAIANISSRASVFVEVQSEHLLILEQIALIYDFGCL